MLTHRYPVKSVLLLLLLGSALLVSKYWILSKADVWLDISMVLVPAQKLAEEGCLANTVFVTPQQILSGEAAVGDAVPYWFSYLGPVLYFAPFCKIFPVESNAPFIAGQLVAYVAVLWAMYVLLLRVYQLPWLQASFVTVLFGVLSSHYSLILNPTQLFAIFLCVLMWRWLRLPMLSVRQGIYLGIIAAIACQFRPEMIAIYAVFLGARLVWPAEPPVRKHIILGLPGVAAFVLGLFLCMVLRDWLGAQSGRPHMMMVWGYDVLGSEYDHLRQGGNLVFSDLFRAPYLYNWFRKLLHSIQMLPGELFFKRFDGMILLAFLGSVVVCWQKLTRGQKIIVRAVGLSVLLLFLMTSMGYHKALHRYFDLSMLLVVLSLVEIRQPVQTYFFHRWRAMHKFILTYKNQAAGGLLLGLLCFSFLLAYRYPDKEAAKQAVRNRFQKYLAPERTVLANDWALWSYYMSGHCDALFPRKNSIEAFMASYNPEFIIIQPADRKEDLPAYIAGLRSFNKLDSVQNDKGEYYYLYQKAAIR
ncbi:MAG: hypothetical protein KF690_04725 [Bacteroidetes bacterium]|nr:hypothetical protein [Bacteroidota bacterium]